VQPIGRVVHRLHVVGGNAARKTLEQGAATTVWAATAAELDAQGGTYLADCQVTDQHAPWAQALAIRRGRIVAVGSDEVVGRMRGIGTRVIDANAVKFMLDGVVESHTAAFLEPYSDDPSLKGSLFWDPEKYKSAVAELDKRGLQLFTHAIGDSGIRTALDAYDFAKTKNYTKDHRPRVEHIEDVSAPDIPRFGKLGVIASMQPLHSYPDADTLDVWARNVGAERATRAWLWKTIADDGGHYAFGSDWPVVTLNPFEGIQVAVTRQTTDGKPHDGFIPSQRLTVAKAIEGYTLDAAYAGHRAPVPAVRAVSVEDADAGLRPGPERGPPARGRRLATRLLHSH
jgi:predicted amidohydrolase YtcJ